SQHKVRSGWRLFADNKTTIVIERSEATQQSQRNAPQANGLHAIGFPRQAETSYQLRSRRDRRNTTEYQFAASEQSAGGLVGGIEGSTPKPLPSGAGTTTGSLKGYKNHARHR